MTTLSVRPISNRVSKQVSKNLSVNLRWQTCSYVNTTTLYNLLQRLPFLYRVKTCKYTYTRTAELFNSLEILYCPQRLKVFKYITAL
jgi:hypothetical protein